MGRWRLKLTQRIELLRGADARNPSISVTNLARSRGSDARRWWMVLGSGAIILFGLAVAPVVLRGGRDTPPARGEPSASSVSVSAAGVGGPAEADDAVRTVEVNALDAMTFEPATIEVAAGEAVTLKVTNAGETVHEFILGDAAMQRDYAEAMSHMPEGLPHELPDAITLQPGETKELTWRFGDPGVLEYACHEPGHYEAGMRGQVRVG
ncbi:MAG: plastocyanin/azurin family copper-binding protein [Chloroflexota bacterium]|nr:plastocyanin/azurin family copper-binding protein [Chloroflexota bacterium]